MNVQISDDGSHLLIISGTKGERIPKLGLSLSYDGDNILIGDRQYKYTEVTSPTSTSAKGLADTIDGYLENIPVLGVQPISLTSALKSGLSSSILIMGDSTENGNTTWPLMLATLLSQKYTTHDFRYLIWNGTTYTAPTFITGADGGRYALNSTSGFFLNNADIPAISGDLDLRAKIRCTDYSTGGWQTVINKWTSTNGTKSFALKVNNIGGLQFLWSADGTAQGSVNSSATVYTNGAVDNNDIWVRVTFDVDNTAAGNTATFYTSTDGITWTQLGTPQITAGVTSIYTGNTSTNWEIGVTASTGEPFIGRIYHVEIRDGIGGPINSPYTIDSWGKYTSAASYVGKPLITVFIGGHSGAAIGFLNDATRLKSMAPFEPYGCIMLSCGHNDNGRVGAGYLADWDTWLTNIRSRIKIGDMILVTQNPQTSVGYEGQARIQMQLVSWAYKNDLKCFDIHSDFLAQPNWQALIQGDSIHPTTGTGGGYEFWAKKVYNYLLK